MDFPRLVSGRELLSIFESLSPDPAGADRVERVIGEVGGDWALKRVPLKLISFSTGSVEAPSSQRLLRRYSKMQTPMPPVILDEFHHGGTEFEIVDGFHRIAVAHQRGDKDVLAYVPVGGAVEAAKKLDWKQRGIKIKITHKPTGPGDDLVIEAFDKAKSVGHLRVYDMGRDITASNVRVDPAYRRLGIATALYQFAEKTTGKRMIPADQAAGPGFDEEDTFTEDARKFWDQPNRPFGAVESAIEPAAPPQHPVVAKLLRVLPLANRLLPEGMKLVPANDLDGLPVVQVLSGPDPLHPIRLGAITFFSTGEDMEWFYKLYGQVPYSLDSGMVYLTYMDETSRVEEPAGLLNLGDEDDTWAERLVTILGLPGASPELPVAPATGEGPTPWHHPIIDMKPMPIETPFWFKQQGGMRQYEPAPKEPIVYPGFKLPDSLWPTGWQPGQPIQQAVEAGKNGDWKQEGYTIEMVPHGEWQGDYEVEDFTPKEHDFVLLVKNKSGKQVGFAHVTHHSPGSIGIAEVSIKQADQRKGLATELYRMAEQLSGKKLVPSDERTEDSEGLWSQPNRPFGVTSKVKQYPDHILPTQGDDFALTDDKKLALKRFEGKALRADSFQDFQELLNKILLELEMTEGYRKSVAGILNRSRKQKGYEAL